MTSTPPRASAFGPLERRLLLIVLAAVLPVVALSWVLLTGNAERQRAALLASARTVTTTIVSALDADFDATISALDYLGEIDWREHQAAREWYTRVKSRPSFRPLLADRVRGISPVSHYADLDF